MDKLLVVNIYFARYCQHITNLKTGCWDKDKWTEMISVCQQAYACHMEKQTSIINHIWDKVQAKVPALSNCNYLSLCPKSFLTSFQCKGTYKPNYLKSEPEFIPKFIFSNFLSRCIFVKDVPYFEMSTVSLQGYLVGNVKLKCSFWLGFCSTPIHYKSHSAKESVNHMDSYMCMEWMLVWMWTVNWTTNSLQKESEDGKLKVE